VLLANDAVDLQDEADRRAMQASRPKE